MVQRPDHHSRSASATLLFAGICALSFGAQTALGSPADTANLIRLGALSPGLVLEQGQAWRVLSCHALHLSGTHLLANLVTLLVLGLLTERLLGGRRQLMLMVGSGVLAAVASVSFSTSVITAGASGVVFGLFGAVIALWIRHGDRLAVPESGWAALGLTGLCALNLGYGLAAPGLDGWSHGGGLVGGAVLGLLLDPRRSRLGTVTLHRSAVLCALLLAGAGWAAASNTTRVVDPRAEAVWRYVQVDTAGYHHEFVHVASVAERTLARPLSQQPGAARLVRGELEPLARLGRERAARLKPHGELGPVHTLLRAHTGHLQAALVRMSKAAESGDDATLDQLRVDFRLARTSYETWRTATTELVKRHAIKNAN